MPKRATANQHGPNRHSAEQLGETLPLVLQPEDGVSFWRPRPTNGYVTVKTSPSYGGPDGITMGTQMIPPGCHVAEHSHDRQVEILFCYAGKGIIEIDGKAHDFVPGTTVVATPWLKHKIINAGSRRSQDDLDHGAARPRDVLPQDRPPAPPRRDGAGALRSAESRPTTSSARPASATCSGRNKASQPNSPPFASGTVAMQRTTSASRLWISSSSSRPPIAMSMALSFAATLRAVANSRSLATVRCGI